MSPDSPTHDLAFKREGSLQSSRAPQRTLKNTMDHGGFVGKEVAHDGNEETTKRTITDYVKNTDPSSIIRRQCGSVVVIYPLPNSITKKDILCRVRGGKVLSCILSEFRGCALAAVTLQDSASAQHYVDFCAETSNKELWPFTSAPDFELPIQVDVTPRVHVYKDAPGLGTIWCPEDIPSSPKAYPEFATRCLFLENCDMKRASKLWDELGLNHSEHLRHQLDDVWLEQSVGYAAAATENESGTLHIWYSDIQTAMKAQQRCPDLKYEMDPCMASPQGSFCSGPVNTDADTQANTEDGTQLVRNKLHIRYHSFPFRSLLGLLKTHVKGGLYRDLLEPSEVFGGICTPQSEEEYVRSMNLTDRLMHALRMHGKERRMKRHGGDQTKVLRPLDATLPATTRTATEPLEPFNYAIPSTAGNEDPFMDDQEGPRVLRRTDQPGNSFSSTVRDCGSFQTSTRYPYAPPPQDSYSNHTVSAFRMSMRSAEPAQTSGTHAVDLHGVTYPPFGIARPQLGYSLQFPPPMSGELAGPENPSTLDQDSSQEPPVQALLNHRLQHISDPGCAPLLGLCVAPSESTENTTGYQSGRSAGLGRSFSGSTRKQSCQADVQAFTGIQIEDSSTASSAHTSSTSRSVSGSMLASDHDENTARLGEFAHLQETGSSESSTASSGDTKTARGCSSPGSASDAPIPPSRTSSNYSRGN